MTRIIDAKEMCNELSLRHKDKVLKIQENIGKKPEFIIINASDNEANKRYIKGKVKAGEEIGIKVTVLEYDETVTNKEIYDVIEKCNNNKIPVILQLPTYDHLNDKLLIDSINYEVDADGFNTKWIGEVGLGNDTLVAPATPKGVINILEYNNINLKGKVALVIGRSNHVGKPLCNMLINRGATVICANSSTKDLSNLVNISDVIISCVGKTNLINPKDIKKDSVLIGVGFTYIEGKQILDFDIDEIVKDNKASIVSNRINCTGKATISSLIDNVVNLYNINFK